MKNIKTIILTLAILAGFTSCDLFLAMPEVTGSVYKEDVFSNRKDAEGNVVSKVDAPVGVSVIM